MAQETAWLDPQHFAVGGGMASLSIFAFNDSQLRGQYLQGRQHTRLGGRADDYLACVRVFASSNDESSS